jgi:hypothetical protein
MALVMFCYKREGLFVTLVRVSTHTKLMKVKLMQFLLILFALKCYHQYAYDGKTFVLSDHRAIYGTNWLVYKKNSFILQRIQLKLSIYEFQVHCVPGSKLCIAYELHSSGVKVQSIPITITRICQYTRNCYNPGFSQILMKFTSTGIKTKKILL